MKRLSVLKATAADGREKKKATSSRGIDLVLSQISLTLSPVHKRAKAETMLNKVTVVALGSLSTCRHTCYSWKMLTKIMKHSNHHGYGQWDHGQMYTYFIRASPPTEVIQTKNTTCKKHTNSAAENVYSPPHEAVTDENERLQTTAMKSSNQLMLSRPLQWKRFFFLSENVTWRHCKFA